MKQLVPMSLCRKTVAFPPGNRGAPVSFTYPRALRKRREYRLRKNMIFDNFYIEQGAGRPPTSTISPKPGLIRGRSGVALGALWDRPSGKNQLSKTRPTVMPVSGRSAQPRTTAVPTAKRPGPEQRGGGAPPHGGIQLNPPPPKGTGRVQTVKSEV